MSDSTSDSNLVAALRNLVAIERDRCLGYPEGELHMAPERAVKEAKEALEEHGERTDELLYPKALDSLGIEERETCGGTGDEL